MNQELERELFFNRIDDAYHNKSVSVIDTETVNINHGCLFWESYSGCHWGLLARSNLRSVDNVLFEFEILSYIIVLHRLAS